jgi:hypothetical protein
LDPKIIPDITLNSYKIVSGDLSMENTIPFSYSLTQIQKDLQKETQQIVSPKYSKESLYNSQDLEEYNSEQSSKNEIIKVRNNNSLVDEIKQIKEKL